MTKEPETTTTTTITATTTTLPDFVPLSNVDVHTENGIAMTDQGQIL